MSHIIDYLDSLPSTAKPITDYKGKSLAPVDWFDTASDRLIKLNNGRYRYIRSNNIRLLFSNFSVLDVKTKSFIKDIQ